MTTETSPTTGWQLQGGSAADAYEQHLVPVIFRGMARGLVTAAGLREGDRVLDVACGTGVVARTAARVVGETGAITAVDVNPDMLATARRVAAGTRPAITFAQGDVTALPLPDHHVDVVCCQEALQFFPDRVAALSEMRRVTVPGGRVACSVLRSLAHHPVYAILAEVLGDHAGSAAREMMASPFALGDAEVLRRDAVAAGLTDVRVTIAVGRERFPSVADFVAWEAASSPLAGPLAALDPHRRGALVAVLEERLAPWCDDSGLAFPNETHVVVGSIP